MTNDQQNYPPVLLIEHLSQILNMSVRTINKRRHSRVWPFTELPRLDRKPRWSRDAVLRIIDANGTNGMRRSA